MKVLVTGTEGYLGCLLAPMLIEAGHDVVAVDAGFYKNGWLYNGIKSTALTLEKDMRHLTEADFEGVDAVVAMAELSNDPVGDLVAPSCSTIYALQSTLCAPELRVAARSTSPSRPSWGE